MAQERVPKLEAALRAVGDDDDSSQPPRGVEESPPASCASVNARQGCWKGPGRGRQPVLQAQTELTRLSAEVVEGEQRLATPSCSAQRLQLLQSTCQQRWRGCVLLWNNCRIPSGCVVGKISFHSATRRCKSGSRADRGIFKRPLWPGSSQKWEGIPTLVQEWQQIIQEQSSVMPSAAANMVR